MDLDAVVALVDQLRDDIEASTDEDTGKCYLDAEDTRRVMAAARKARELLTR